MLKKKTKSTYGRFIENQEFSMSLATKLFWLLKVAREDNLKWRKNTGSLMREPVFFFKREKRVRGRIPGRDDGRR